MNNKHLSAMTTLVSSLPVERTFHRRPRRPFAALVVPIDIKNQITDERIQQITFCSFEQHEDDANLCLCYVEFDDGTADEWEVPFQGNYEWQSWWGWKLAYRGQAD